MRPLMGDPSGELSAVRRGEKDEPSFNPTPEPFLRIEAGLYRALPGQDTSSLLHLRSAARGYRPGSLPGAANESKKSIKKAIKKEGRKRFASTLLPVTAAGPLCQYTQKPRLSRGALGGAARWATSHEEDYFSQKSYFGLVPRDLKVFSLPDRQGR